MASWADLRAADPELAAIGAEQMCIRDSRYTTGVLAKYARLVTGAERGAVTEP